MCPNIKNYTLNAVQTNLCHFLLILLFPSFITGSGRGKKQFFVLHHLQKVKHFLLTSFRSVKESIDIYIVKKKHGFLENRTKFNFEQKETARSWTTLSIFFFFGGF